MMYALVILTTCGGSTANIASHPVVEAARSSASQWMPSPDKDGSPAWHNNPNETCSTSALTGASKDVTACKAVFEPHHKVNADDLDLKPLDKPLDNTTALSAKHWRPTTDDLPTVALTLMLTWFFIGWTLKRRKSAEDTLFEKQRLQNAMDRLAQTAAIPAHPLHPSPRPLITVHRAPLATVQVSYETSSVEKKRAAYLERKEKLEKAAAARIDKLVASGDVSEADVPAAKRRAFDQLAREAPPSLSEGKASCFAAKEIPVRMTPENVLGAVVDEISGRPVDELPGLHTLLGPEFAAEFTEKIEEVQGILVDRTVELLDKTMEKTATARASGTLDPSQLAYSSGQKLAHHLQIAKRVATALKQRRVARSSSLLAQLAGGRSPTEGRLKTTLDAAKAMRRQ
eukprot:264351-Prymnesium_polylepis.1